MILAVTEEDERAGRERVAMQQAAGLDGRWLSAAEAAAVDPTLGPDGHRGGSYLETDGHIDPPRNVRAYSLAMQARRRRAARADGVHGSPDRADRRRRPAGRGRRDRSRRDRDGARAPDRWARAPGGRRDWPGSGSRPGAVRHTVAVLEPHEAFAVDRQPMVFDIGAGLYWRLEEGGLLFGWSDPNDRPGEAREIDWAMYEAMRERLAGFVPVTRGLGLRKIWAATIDFTPDHLPILGPGLRRRTARGSRA